MAKIASVCLLCSFQHLIGFLFVPAANNFEWSTDQPVVILEKNFFAGPEQTSCEANYEYQYLTSSRAGWSVTVDGSPH